MRRSRDFFCLFVQRISRVLEDAIVVAVVVTVALDEATLYFEDYDHFLLYIADESRERRFRFYELRESLLRNASSFWLTARTQSLEIEYSENTFSRIA